MNVRRLLSLVLSVAALGTLMLAFTGPASAAGGPSTSPWNVNLTVNQDGSAACYRWYPQLVTMGKCDPTRFITVNPVNDSSGNPVGFTTTLVTANHPRISFVQGSASYGSTSGYDTVTYTNPNRVVTNTIQRCDSMNGCDTLDFESDYILAYVPKWGSAYGIG